jgi:hypothetical protein
MKWRVELQGVRLFSQNERNRWHPLKRARKDKALKRDVGILMSAMLPKGAWIRCPHPRRTLNITRFGKRIWDEDNFVAAAKPLLDALKCPRKKVGGEAVVLDGLIWDDSSEYVLVDYLQEKSDTDKIVIEIEE